MNQNSPYIGKWKITQMETWGQDYVDLVVPGYVEFDADESGSFQFGTVRGWADCRIETFNDEEVIAFSWEGMNDTDTACGRGWAILVGDGEKLYGRIFIHNSDDSNFHAEKMDK